MNLTETLRVPVRGLPGVRTRLCEHPVQSGSFQLTSVDARDRPLLLWFMDGHRKGKVW